MLIFTRKADKTGAIGSSFEIGGSRVVILNSRGNTVQVGIEAPAIVPILRDDAKLKTQTQGSEHVTQRP